MELSLPFPRRESSRRRSGAIARTGVPRTLAWLSGNRLVLRATVVVLVALPLLGGGWLWLRDSSFVTVRHVHITGVHGTGAIEIRSALDAAASRMSTMDFNAASLRSAVSSFAIVGALNVTTSFPHSVSISVTERPPVAALQSAGQRTAVAADGTVLGPAWLSSSLPVVTGSVEPPAGGHVREASALAAVAVLGAAPAPLARFVVRVYEGPEGLTVGMRNGLLVYFGDNTRPHAKWLSLARVLTSPSAAGALYVDVRLPERPAAGFSSPSSSSSSSSAASSSSASSASMPVQTSTSDPTAAALAARLSKAAGGEAKASSPASGSAATETSSGSSPTSSGESETASGPSEASTPSGGEAEPGG
jgi:cell division protein FtsQ